MAYEKPMAALADATRRRIFERVARAPASVGEIAANLPVSRPAVSQHLKVLKQAGLVSETRAGTRRIYAAETAALGELRNYVDAMWSRALAGFAAAAKEKGRQR